MRIATGLAAFVLLVSATPSFAEEDQLDVGRVKVEEWKVPWENTRPRDPYVENENSVWFAGQRGHYLGHLDVATGEMTKVDLTDEAGPHNLILSKSGDVWYSGNLKGYVGRYDRKTGDIEKIETPGVKDPHTLIFDEGEQHIYFTAQFSNYVGRLTLADRKVELTRVERDGARPYGIDIAPDGTPWVVLFGTNQLARINKDMSLSYVDLPREDARPRRIGITSDGRIWYVDFNKGYLGVYDPANGGFKEWLMPAGEAARPYGMAVDKHDNIWFVQTGVMPNTFVGFDPATESYFSSTPIPSGARAIRHMDYDEETGTVWFGTDANTVGRAKVD